MGLRELRSVTAELGGQPLYYRHAGDDEVPVLYLHGALTSSDDWVAPLARTGGLAPDLPGFGRSGKRGDLDYSPDGYADFLDRFLELVGVDRVRLVVHGWGAVGLVWALRDPARVERLVVLNAAALLPGVGEPAACGLLRRRGAGEFLIGLASAKPVMGRVIRHTTTRRGRPSAALRDEILAHFDQGTQRAILRLHRSATPERLAAAGAQLGRITAPALVLWGAEDPWFSPDGAHAYAAALGDARAELVPDAGHWPWRDRPELIERLCAHLEGTRTATNRPAYDLRLI